MKNFTLKREPIKGEKEVITVTAKSMKEAWLKNVDAPLPSRSQRYKGSDRTGNYYLGVWVGDVWTFMEEIK